MSDFPDWTVPTNIQNPEINVQVQGGNIDANITNAEVGINIKKSEIVLDVGSTNYYMNYTEVGQITETPQGWHALDQYRGRFFAHNVFGYIWWLRAVVRNNDTVQHTVTFYLAVWPGGPALYTFSKTVDSEYTGWVTVESKVVWPYDTLFIYIKADSAQVEIGYYSTGYEDSFYSSDGKTWKEFPSSYVMYVSVTTSAKAYVAVGGTVTAVPPPKQTKAYSNSATGLPTTQETTLITIAGRGKLKCAILRAEGSNSRYLRPRIYADGQLIIGKENWTYETMHKYGFENRITGLRLILYDDTSQRYVVELCTELEFNRELKIAVYNPNLSSTPDFHAENIIVELY